jgi:hypothetical protein
VWLLLYVQHGGQEVFASPGCCSFSFAFCIAIMCDIWAMKLPSFANWFSIPHACSGMTALEAATPVEEDAQDDDLARYEEKRSTSQEYLTVAKNAMKESRFRHAAVVLTDAIATCRARSIQADHSI